MNAGYLKTIIREWLDKDDATHWGDFEKDLDSIINGSRPERELIVAMLRHDGKQLVENGKSYSEESPSGAEALQEAGTTLLFKAAQIERGDHLSFALPTSEEAGA